MLSIQVVTYEYQYLSYIKLIKNDFLGECKLDFPHFKPSVCTFLNGVKCEGCVSVQTLME